MEHLFELLSTSFYQNILWVAVLGSVLASLASFIIGYGNFAGITGSLAHMILGGVGIAGFFNFSPFLGSLMIVMVSCVILTFVQLRSPKNLELIGNILWGVGMALGILFVSLSKGYQLSLESFLFGNILLVSFDDVTQSFILNITAISLIVLLFRQLLLVMFNPDLARAQNLPIFFLYFILMLIISFSIINLVKTVGIVLSLVLLSVPFYTVRLLTQKILWVLVGSFLFSLLSIILGLMVSYQYNVPTSSIIALISLGIFVALQSAVWFVKWILKKKES